MSGQAPITFIAPVVPGLSGNGLAMRAGLFLDGLARNHRVRLVVIPVFPSREEDRQFAYERAASCVTIELAEPDDTPAIAIALLGTASGRRRAGELYPLPSNCPALSAAGRAELERQTSDAQLVHVMRSYLAPALDDLLDSGDRPAVTLDLDELDSRVQHQLGDREEAARFERLERHYLSLFDHVYVASDSEAQLLRTQLLADRISVIPNAVERPARTPSDQHYDLLFVGNLSYAPNVDAACWLCREIRPLLGKATIAIVGRDPQPDVIALGDLPGVTVAGDVPEVTSWYANSRVAVVPLRIGGGSPTKTIEALAHGRPVVATGRGAIGAEASVLRADSAEAFAAACRRLLDDRNLAVRLGEEGRQRVRTRDDVMQEIDRLTVSCLSPAQT